MKNHFIRCAVAMLLMLSLYNVKAAAQFYTVCFVSQAADTLSLSSDPYANGFPLISTAKVGTEIPIAKSLQEKCKKSGEKSFPQEKTQLQKLTKNSLMDTTYSLVLELIKKRLTVCMPLDLIKVNSPYGYRRDPFKKCRKFHDGIDLQGVNEVVFSMLPGIVHKVSYGNTGYGNHVILDHGKIRCLYGHLSEIFVREGDIVEAGTIVSRVGNSGRSTNFHLHCRIQLFRDGKCHSMDPQILMDMLNKYINEHNERIDFILGRNSIDDDTLPELTIANVYAELKRQGVKHPRIVLAQTLLESGNFTSKLTRTHNNILGIRTRRGPFQRFRHWSECITAYRDFVQYRYKGSPVNESSYYAFLDRIKYAGDSKTYINKVRKIAERLYGQ